MTGPVLASTVGVFGSVGGAIAGFLILVSALAVVSAIFKANRAQATIKVLQDLGDALSKQNLQQQHEIDGQAARMDKLTAENVMLREMVQSKAAVDKLAAQMAENHAEVVHLLQPRGTR